MRTGTVIGANFKRETTPNHPTTSPDTHHTASVIQSGILTELFTRQNFYHGEVRSALHHCPFLYGLVEFIDNPVVDCEWNFIRDQR